LTGCWTKRTSDSSCTTSWAGAGNRPVRKAGRSCRAPSSERAPSRLSGSKLHGPPPASPPEVKLRGSNDCNGWGTTTASLARPGPSATATVRSTTSSNSAIGTAGGRT